eukprot:6276011-Pyramimonas_sp.AAC.1
MSTAFHCCEDVHNEVATLGKIVIKTTSTTYCYCGDRPSDIAKFGKSGTQSALRPVCWAMLGRLEAFRKRPQDISV